MDANRFDAVTRLFARRRASRRRNLSRGGLSLVAAAISYHQRPAAAQQATPGIVGDAKRGPTMLFIQSFRGGSVSPKPAEDGRFQLTLENGLGQTIYFSDRPDRVVGATPTPQFLSGLGFPQDNPPNAALIVENGTNDTDIAVVELFAPRYDVSTHTATYDVEILEQWERKGIDFAEQPTDLATLHPTFGAAHLFIDDCAATRAYCSPEFPPPINISQMPSLFTELCYSATTGYCLPCDPWTEDLHEMATYWRSQCNAQYSSCNGDCFAYFFCEDLSHIEFRRGSICDGE